MEKLIGREYTEGTLRKFKSAYKSLKAFIAWNFKKEEIEFTEVSHEFFTDDEFYLKTVQDHRCNQGGVFIYIEFPMQVMVEKIWMLSINSSLRFISCISYFPNISVTSMTVLQLHISFLQLCGRLSGMGWRGIDISYWSLQGVRDCVIPLVV